MRITGGQLKGKEVASYKDAKTTLRPTSSKVREALFNLLRHGKFLGELNFYDPESASLLEGATMLDLYTGTGIFSFESLSRGLKHATLVDISEQNMALARKNAYSLGVQDKCNFQRADATKLPKTTTPCDIIFLDPPYKENLLKATVESVLKYGWAREGSLIIVEHSKLEDFSAPQGTELLDQRLYNNTSITFLRVA